MEQNQFSHRREGSYPSHQAMIAGLSRWEAARASQRIRTFQGRNCNLVKPTIITEALEVVGCENPKSARTLDSQEGNQATHWYSLNIFSSLQRNLTSLCLGGVF